LVSEYIEHYNEFNTDELVNMFTDDCIFQNVTNSAGIVECKGKAQVRDVSEQSKSLFKKRKQTITNWIIDGNRVAIELDYVAEMACDLDNGIKAGDHIKIRGISVFLFENGKIKRLVDYS
jgi:steroid delta-isomerase-like uncharacterized protein